MRVCFYVSLVQVITPFNLDNPDRLCCTVITSVVACVRMNRTAHQRAHVRNAMHAVCKLLLWQSAVVITNTWGALHSFRCTHLPKQLGGHVHPMIRGTVLQPLHCRQRRRKRRICLHNSTGAAACACRCALDIKLTRNILQLHVRLTLRKHSFHVPLRLGVSRACARRAHAKACVLRG